MTDKPITNDMDAVLARTPRAALAADVLLRHCLAMGGEEGGAAGGETPVRRPARARLEEALGPELARRLVSSLTATGRS